MNIEKRIATSAKGDITIYKVTNRNGSSIEVSSLGAGLLSVIVPDIDGNMADVVLGYANPADYLYDGPCAGKIPGRYANRIAKGEFHIGDKTYNLAINNGPNALHGGPEGFQNQIWNSLIDGNSVVFSYTSVDGEEGYPGNLQVTVKYTWDDSNALKLDFEAICDADTIVNLTNHTYFNLAGEDAGSVLSHRLWLASHNYVPTDSTLVPIGNIEAVEDTPMDFTVAKELGKDIKAQFPALIYGKGYDNCWLIDDWDGNAVKRIAELTEAKSKRKVEVFSNQPAVQVYTGDWLAGSSKSKSGHDYNDYDGVAIECQGVPDAPNKPQFPSQLLKAGNKYNRAIVFAFGICDES